jgi:hypothetical protein
MNCGEAQELITALVDGELLESDRESLTTHLAGCHRCQFSVEAERGFKQSLQGSAMRLHVPDKLRDRIASDPRIFPNKSEPAKIWQRYFQAMHHLARPALAAAVLLAIILPVFFFFRGSTESLATAALESYQLFRSGDLTVHRTENPNDIADQLTRAVDGRFHPMGYDLTAMNLRPVAGLVREIQGRTVLVAIYQGEGGTLFCYTFLGSEADAPANAARFFDADKKINFYAFSHGRVNAVLHRENDVICILAAEMPMEQLLTIARSESRRG